VWGSTKVPSNVTAYVTNAARYLTDAPTPGVMYTSLDYSPPAYFDPLMQVGSGFRIRILARILAVGRELAAPWSIMLPVGAAATCSGIQAVNSAALCCFDMSHLVWLDVYSRRVC